MKEILITCNSPGEVASWLRVTLPEIRRLAPQARIEVALVPCPYATGAEKSVVERLEGLDRVYSPWQTVGLALRPGQHPAKGLVLFLGGDPWHALLLGWRLGYRTAGYFERPTCWSRRFDLPLYNAPTEGEPVQAHVVGNLMVDGLQASGGRSRADLGLDADRPVIGLFPGSRHLHQRVTLAAYLAVAENLLAASRGRVQFVLLRSPFVTPQGLQKAIDNPWSVGLPVATATVHEDRIVCQSGLTIPMVTGLPGEVFSLFDFAVTIPGTNTAELACCAKPFLVTLHRLAFFGGGGLVGVFERFPLLPDSWKIRLRQRKHKRYGFLVAHPNLVAGRVVAPEVIVRDTTADLEKEILRWIDDPEGRQRMGQELQAVMGASGAARRLAEAVVKHLETI